MAWHAWHKGISKLEDACYESVGGPGLDGAGV